jgi:hypothetical protein
MPTLYGPSSGKVFNQMTQGSRVGTLASRTAAEATVNYDLLRTWSLAQPELHEFYLSTLHSAEVARESVERPTEPAGRPNHRIDARRSRPRVQPPVHAAPKPVISWKRRQQTADRIWQALCRKLEYISPNADRSVVPIIRLVEQLEANLYRRAVDGCTYANMLSHVMRRIRTVSDAQLTTPEALWLHLASHLRSSP